MRSLLLIGLMCASLPALDQLDVPIARQWFTPIQPDAAPRLSGAWGVEQAAAVRGAATTLQRAGGFASVTGRVWHDANAESWVRATIVDIRVDSDAALPVTGQLPHHLQDIRLGGFWRMKTASGAIVGVDAELSSPSDQPYANREVIAHSATLFSRVPTTGMDAWLLVLRHDSTSAIRSGVPLPGVGYQWMRPGLRASLGIPFAMIDWRPIDDWSVSANYFPIDTGNIAVCWAPGSPALAMAPTIAPWAARAGMSVNYETWLRADRVDHDDRLTFRTIRAYVSGSWEPSSDCSLQLAVGRILLREVYETHNRSTRADNNIRIDPAWYGALSFKLGF